MPTPSNPFFAPSELPYALPPFDLIDSSHYPPAFEQGMADQLAEVEAIVADPQPPTFENTIVELERSGQLLERVAVVFFNQASSDSDAEIRAIQSDVAPKLAAHSDAIHLEARLFDRIVAVRESDPELDPESQRLLDRYHLEFVRAGAGLDAAAQVRLRELNAEISSLSTTFQQNLQEDTNASAVVLDDVAELDGLSD
ncbi:MAG: M3 family metallopeptidase, partial [Jiangellaceae bacterium]